MMKNSYKIEITNFKIGNDIKIKVINLREIKRILKLKSLSSINKDIYFENEEIFLSVKTSDIYHSIYTDKDVYDMYTIYIGKNGSLRDCTLIRSADTNKVVGEITKGTSYADCTYLSIEDTKDIITRSRKLNKQEKEEYLKILENNK